MKILYDIRAFQIGKFGGYSRYFSELMSHYLHDETMGIIFPKMYVNNFYYNQLLNQNNIPQPPTPLHNTIIGTGYRVNRYICGKIDATICSYNTNKLLARENYELFHPTFDYLRYRKHITGKPFVVTCHDLIWHNYAEKSKSFKNMHLQKLNDFDFGYTNATRIIAISESTKRELLHHYPNLEEDRIDVIYHGSSFEEIINTKEACNDELSPDTGKYLLFVGSRGWYKNYNFFIKSAAPILQEYPDIEIICVGGGKFSKSEISDLSSLKMLSRVHQMDVDDTKLKRLYQNALCFVFPSLMEGFGLPTLEAFSCGCPVLLSASSCMPEVGGDAAIYFDPTDSNSLKEALYTIINDDGKLRYSMISKGHKQLKKFSWDKTAEKTKETYKKTLE